MRLVRKDAGHTFAVVLSYLAGVSIHRHSQKFLGNTRIHQVNIKLAAIPGRRAGALYRSYQVFALRKCRPGTGLLSNIIVTVLCKTKGRHGILFELSHRILFGNHKAAPPGLRHGIGNEPSGKARWVRVLIVDPNVHIEPLGFFESYLPEPEPILRKIRRHQSRPGMNEDLPYLLAGQVLKGADYLLVGQIVVPNPQRSRMILPRRIGKLPLYSGRILSFQHAGWKQNRKKDKSPNYYAHFS